MDRGFMAGQIARIFGRHGTSQGIGGVADHIHLVGGISGKIGGEIRCTVFGMSVLAPFQGAVVAQGDNLPAVPYANLPVHGATYWEILPGGFTAPLPGPIFDPSLPIYAITPTVFVVDSTFGEILVNPRQSAGLSPTAALTAVSAAEATKVANLISQVQTSSTQTITPTVALASSATPAKPAISGGRVSPDGQQQQSGVPYLTIATVTNQFLITVDNDTTQGLYYLQSTPVLGNANYPWSTIASGTNGQTNSLAQRF